MENKIYDSNLNNKLFGLSYLSDYSEEEQEKRIDLAAKAVDEYGEKQVFQSWFLYLKTSVTDPMDAWSFMLWFYNFNGADFKIDDPYPFLGMLFKKLSLSFNELKNGSEEKEKFDTFDTIYASMLIKSGLVAEDDYFNVNPYRDERLKAEIDKLGLPSR